MRFILVFYGVLAVLVGFGPAILRSNTKPEKTLILTGCIAAIVGMATIDIVAAISKLGRNDGREGAPDDIR